MPNLSGFMPHFITSASKLRKTGGVQQASFQPQTQKFHLASMSPPSRRINSTPEAHRQKRPRIRREPKSHHINGNVAAALAAQTVRGDRPFGTVTAAAFCGASGRAERWRTTAHDAAIDGLFRFRWPHKASIFTGCTVYYGAIGAAAVAAARRFVAVSNTAAAALVRGGVFTGSNSQQDTQGKKYCSHALVYRKHHADPLERLFQGLQFSSSQKSDICFQQCQQFTDFPQTFAAHHQALCSVLEWIHSETKEVELV